ncbi:MAG: glycine cleavage system H-protein subunit [Thelocarpon impressellum]|nr:MAG: glycine cleavage system H-protein subunit [Thelocarpon impressellum]
MASLARVVRPVGSRLSSRAANGLQWQQWARLQPVLPSKRAFAGSSAGQAKKYTQDHEWIELSDDGKTGTIGISTYAAKALGDVVYVELPTPDLSVSAGDAIGAVESVKSASDILTPVSGTVLEANSALEEKPGTINKGPEAEGWIARIEVADASEVEGLMGGEEYAKFTEE